MSSPKREGSFFPIRFCWLSEIADGSALRHGQTFICLVAILASLLR